MVKKHMKSADNMYHINGHKYQVLNGSRAQVWQQHTKQKVILKSPIY